MTLRIEDIFCLFRHQQRIAVDSSHEDANLSHHPYSLPTLKIVSYPDC
ncbi:hypothetical protein SSYIS1_19210 [Serratia symbiotica]|uniref:Uncharacterized protein n=1 Tax=Serratia symbiotica TaxID=138074 RepID=A0A455VNI6_9GAMM|nr:hypothetical protein SSYIS1_19210 [Serratia symbiotica]